MPIISIDLEIKTQQLSIAIYGYTGSGKTHLAGTAPDNLYLDLENGYATLLNVPFTGKVFHCDTARELRQVIAPFGNAESTKEAIDKLGFQPKVLTIDTLSRMQQNSQLDIIDHREVKAGRQEDVMEMREWGQMLIQAYRLMKILPNQGYDIIALVQAREFEDPATKVVKWMPNLQGQFGDQIGAYFDILAFLEIHQLTDGSVVHRLHLQPSGGWTAKSRYQGLPPYLDNPTFPQIKEMILKARQSLKALKESKK